MSKRPRISGITWYETMILLTSFFFFSFFGVALHDWCNFSVPGFFLSFFSPCIFYAPLFPRRKPIRERFDFDQRWPSFFLLTELYRTSCALCTILFAAIRNIINVSVTACTLRYFIPSREFTFPPPFLIFSIALSPVLHHLSIMLLHPTINVFFCAWASSLGLIGSCVPY